MLSLVTVRSIAISPQSQRTSSELFAFAFLLDAARAADAGLATVDLAGADFDFGGGGGGAKKSEERRINLAQGG